MSSGLSTGDDSHQGIATSSLLDAEKRDPIDPKEWQLARIRLADAYLDYRQAEYRHEHQAHYSDFWNDAKQVVESEPVKPDTEPVVDDDTEHLADVIERPYKKAQALKKQLIEFRDLLGGDMEALQQELDVVSRVFQHLASKRDYGEEQCPSTYHDDVIDEVKKAEGKVPDYSFKAKISKMMGRVKRDEDSGQRKI